jgi:hypothetical protein
VREREREREREEGNGRKCVREIEREREEGREIGMRYIYVYKYGCVVYLSFSLLRLNLLYRTRYIYYVVVK